MILEYYDPAKIYGLVSIRTYEVGEWLSFTHDNTKCDRRSCEFKEGERIYQIRHGCNHPICDSYYCEPCYIKSLERRYEQMYEFFNKEKLKRINNDE